MSNTITDLVVDSVGTLAALGLRWRGDRLTSRVSEDVSTRWSKLRAYNTNTDEADDLSDRGPYRGSGPSVRGAYLELYLFFHCLSYLLYLLIQQPSLLVYLLLLLLYLLFQLLHPLL